MPMTHVFFIEGLPGSGKTTFSARLEKTLKAKGYTVSRYGEGMHNPLDLAWIAILSNDAFFDVLKRYPRYSEEIRTHTVKCGDDYHLAFLFVESAVYDSVFKREMEKHEIYRTESLETFLGVHRERFATFARESDSKTVHIFDGALLQNHLNETMLKYELDEEATVDYLRRLSEPLNTLNTTVLYTREADVGKTLKRIADERDVSPLGDKVWIDMVADYVESHPAARTHGYKGREGVLRYFIERQKRALRVIRTMDMASHVLTLKDGDYDEMFEHMRNMVLEQLKR